MTAEIYSDLPCHVCGYDLRAHPQDRKCPECGASVAEARRWAAIPRRPAWRDSDPRWRRRMLAGAWVLVLMPLSMFGWLSYVPVPAVFDFRGAVRTLDETLAADFFVHQPLLFCIGVVLLFSKERGWRRHRLDWTRRWGVLCTYVVLLLSAALLLQLAALVLAGIAAVFQSMPLKYQPSATGFFVELSTGYLSYGASPKDATIVVLFAFSSIVILLACVPLYEALSGSGSKRLAVILLTPLGIFSLMNLAQVCRYFSFHLRLTSTGFGYLGLYFRPELFFWYWNGLSTFTFVSAAVEAIKWCIVLAIAVWLSIAQLAAWMRRRKTSEA
jgi:hypothetical protein